VFQEEIPSDHDHNYDTQDDISDESSDEDQEMKKKFESDEMKIGDRDIELEYDSESDQEIEKLKKPVIDVDLKGYSGFLSKFLATKKTPDVPPPPIPIPLNDYILKEFALSEKSRSQKRPREEDEDEDEDNDEEEREVIELNSSDDGNQPTVIDLSDSIFTSHTLTLFNLPYNITADEVPLLVLLSLTDSHSSDHLHLSSLWCSESHSQISLW
jgi:hypothetical protein